MDYFVKASGVDTNDGMSWATAKATVVASVTAMAAGDRLFISNTLYDGTATGKTLPAIGTPDRPIQIYSVLEDVMPPTLAAATSTQIRSTGTGTHVLQGSMCVYGIWVSGGSNSSSSTITFGSSISTDVIQIFNDVTFNMASLGNAGAFVFGSNSGSNTSRSKVFWNNCNATLAQSAQRFEVNQEFIWRGGSLSTSVPLSAVFRNSANGRGSLAMIEGVDFTGLPTTTDLINGSFATGKITFRNCSLPVNWTGQLVQGIVDPGLRAEMHNCDSGDTNYRLWVAAFSGTIKSETGVVKASGANDGSTSFSWKVETNANPTTGFVGLESPELVKWNTTTGKPVTVSFDVLTDGAALTNADMWLDVQYLGNSGTPKGSFASNKPAPLAAPVAHPTSTANWSTSAMTAPKKQTLSVTFTPQKVGAIHCKLVVSKPNAVVYIDPKVM